MTQDVLMATDDDTVAPTTETSRNQINKFCTLSKNAQGAALLELIEQAIAAPGVYVFGELLDLPNIQNLKDGEGAKHYNTLNLFAYGTCKQYKQNVDNFIQLTPAMQKKLQHLTIVSLAIKTKNIPYDIIMEELEIDNIRHLEDTIIEAIYADIIHGKLFQNTRVLEIDYAQGRDIPPGYTSKIAETLQDWVNSCDGILNCIDDQITRANVEKAKRCKNRERLDNEMQNLRKVLKNQGTESDEAMQVDSRDSTSSSSSTHDMRKKAGKSKTPRPSVGSSLKFSK